MEQENIFAELLAKGSSDFGITITSHHTVEFLTYLHELLDWNKKTNLTAITEEQEVIVKHFLDSIACSKALKRSHSASLLDVGSGAGFPGLPLKIVYPNLELTLLEPSQKKTAFLRHIIGTLHMKKVVVISKRVQDLVKDQNYNGRFSFIVARALEANQVLPFIRPLLKAHGRLILYRAKPLEQHTDLGGLQLKEELYYSLPCGYGDRVLSVLELAA